MVVSHGHYAGGVAQDVDEKLSAKEYIPKRDTPISLNPFSFIKIQEDFNACESVIVEWLLSLLQAEPLKIQGKDHADSQILKIAFKTSWNLKKIVACQIFWQLLMRCQKMRTI